jgi:putative nucleotidyltransferase with HDIG domain
MPATVKHGSLMDIHPRELERFVTDLPTLPVIFQELFARMNDPEARISELAELIARDQALTTKILRMVNSAFYGSGSHVGTISRAVIILGFQAVRSAALAVSVLERFKDLPDGGRHFPLDGFWRHSIGVSCLARQASLVLHVGEPDDAFVAGLLHDTGKLVMLQHFPADVEDLTRAAGEQRLTWSACEEMLFPIGHASIGEALFRAWNFPAGVIEAVSCHHAPGQASRHAELAALVHLADFFSYHLDCGCPGGTGARTHADDAGQLVKLTPDLAGEIVRRAREEFAESLELLKLLD